MIVVFAEDVREKGGAIVRPGVEGSFLGKGESLRDDRADATLGPGRC